MKVVIAGGGTAGHVFPALAVAEELRGRGADVVFIGSDRGQEAALVPAEGFAFVPVHALPAQTRLSLGTVRALGVALVESWRLRERIRGVDVVVGAGGFASAAPVLAARWTRRPVVLIDQNSVPGVVNRVAARWARVVATTFEATATHLPSGVRIVRTGNPIRSSIAAVPGRREALRAEGLDRFGLDGDRLTVLVVGGSQGALRIDTAVAGALARLAERDDLQLLVSTGPAHERVVADAVDPSAALRVRVVPFIDRMDVALAVADLAVSRAGASVAELAACGLPSVLIPYPYATEHHQDGNAAEVVAAGAAVLLADTDCTPERLSACILELMDAPERRRVMAEAALAWARPDAARRVSDLVMEVAG